MSKNEKYILINIGCIECGVSSNVVGLFNDKELAEKEADRLKEDMNWRGGGQNDYEVFELPKEINQIKEEYLTND